ncbi:hypothetical protein OC861_005671 [Tilletia horrida]|nr:hypothetical protein OC861_005671 [Tilletia horrida]
MAGSALAAPPDVQRGCAGKCSVAGLPDQDAIIRCNVNCQYCFDMKVKGYLRSGLRREPYVRGGMPLCSGKVLAKWY